MIYSVFYSVFNIITYWTWHIMCYYIWMFHYLLVWMLINSTPKHVVYIYFFLFLFCIYKIVLSLFNIKHIVLHIYKCSIFLSIFILQQPFFGKTKLHMVINLFLMMAKHCWGEFTDRKLSFVLHQSLVLICYCYHYHIMAIMWIVWL